MKRFWEIDAVRGIAIVLMIFFHAAFDLNYFTQYKLDFGWLFWFLFPRLIASTFIIVSGIALTLSYHRSKTPMKKFAMRGLKIFSLGLLVTAFTLLVFPAETIWFGILHFIGVATVLSLPFVKMKKQNLAIGLIIILLGVYFDSMQFGLSWMSWLIPSHFFTFDYFPLFPWFGLTLIGTSIGNSLYSKSQRRFKMGEANKFGSALAFLGRNSLAIYFLHQPLIALALLLLGIPASI
ncbi:MAG: heparan-alpha-glucosaminide N-acetyltransferase [Candidatus Aenigmatarchaeota archaeon]